MGALAFIPSAEAAAAMVELAGTGDFPFRAMATWWLFNRKDNEWKEHGLAATMKSRGLYDPDQVKLTQVVSPEPPARPSHLPAIAEILKLAGDPERGRASVAARYACHPIRSHSAPFRPALTTFRTTPPN